VRINRDLTAVWQLDTAWTPFRERAQRGSRQWADINRPLKLDKCGVVNCLINWPAAGQGWDSMSAGRGWIGRLHAAGAAAPGRHARPLYTPRNSFGRL
jgi:hypothetical protein